MRLSRRGFVRASAAGVAAGSVLLAGAGRAARPPSPAAASLPSATPVLAPELRAVAAALGDALVPGAAAAGFASYLEAQLSCPPEESLLMLRYLGIAPPYRDFYLPALGAVQSWSIARHGTGFEQLDAAQRERVLQEMASGAPAPWNAAPAPFVYFVLRADAIDVGYGTRAGFERLGIPHMAHILPETDW
jgi:hypothetical protein